MKVDVAIQSYKKPESLVYTLLSLKKYCGTHVDTVYINDDCSGEDILKHYLTPELISVLKPIKIITRVNNKPSGYTHTIVTKEIIQRKKVKTKIQLGLHFLIHRAKWYNTTNDIRYQWAINSTDKQYVFLIHDDIKFYDDVLGLYIKEICSDKNLAIVGDLGGSKRCIYGPCGQHCGPKQINKGIYPCASYPNMGAKSLIYKLLGRYRRYCRINEWCALINVAVCRELEEEGTYFGNYESGGDVGTYWFDRVLKKGYRVYDPLPTRDMKNKYYLHWWQGHEGHDVWVDRGNGKAVYEKKMIIDRIYEDFGYKYR